MKKAEAQQVFIYIMAILIVGAILLIGVRSIMNIFDRACEVDETAFKRDIEDLLNRYSRYGSIGYETLRVPCNYDDLIFINTDNCDDINQDDYPIIRNECEAQTGNNVFIQQGQTTLPLFSINNMRAKNNIEVIEPRGGRYYLRLEGIGQARVMVEHDEV